MVRRFHPDGLATQGSVAINHLAEEILIHVNRAYDRLRRDLVAAGRASAMGSALMAPRGWLVGFDDALGIERRRSASASIRFLGGAVDEVVDITSDRIIAVPDGVRPPWRSSSFDDGIDALSAAPLDEDETDDLTDQVSIDSDETDEIPAVNRNAAHSDNITVLDGASYEARARILLATGANEVAQELLAAALVSYPRSRTLRSLYYVASALVALDGNQRMRATSQLEAALAHADGDGRGVATAILEQLANNAAPDLVAIKRLFS